MSEQADHESQFKGKSKPSPKHAKRIKRKPAKRVRKVTRKASRKRAPLSKAGKKRIAVAQRKRWASWRKNGKPAMKRRAAASMNGDNPYLAMTVPDLVTAKRHMDAAWKLATKAIRK